jgi:hypothetical protein
MQTSRDPTTKGLIKQAVKVADWKSPTNFIVEDNILKTHLLEKHVCAFNEKWGVGDKEESFMEQGHQVGLKDDRCYHGLTTFEMRTESLLKARSKMPSFSSSKPK